ncbi:hypothetical protein [Halobacillus seohaensis]|uniref:Resolvase HTH domain-containing protein n=1 Tax=Halobacillus seohaensis TaxID=447421 RepID=A0ABW2EIJ1_9BACI
MIPTLITLISIGIVLFIASFFMNDRLKDVEDQVEQLSIQVMQDTYQIKKKLNVLEEELLSEDLTEEILKQPRPAQSNKPPLVKTIQSMYQGGFSVERIAKETNLSEHDVQSMVRQSNVKGVSR